MRVKMLQDIRGSFHIDCATGKGHYDVKRDQIVEVPEADAKRYIENKIAERA